MSHLSQPFWKRFFLYLPSQLFGLVAWLRNKGFDYQLLSSKTFDIPIICLGNITVGGTGKTPHTEYLIELLNNKKHVAVLSRGYKRKTSGFVLATKTATAQTIGDEPFQIYQKFANITVAVDEKRVHGINQLLQQADKPDVILLDDAFQHRYVTPSFSIVLIDYNRPIQTDTFLPLGRLRESPKGVTRANCVIVTKCPSSDTIDEEKWRKSLNLRREQSLFFTTIVYDSPQAVFHAPALNWDKKNIKKPDILVVTGVVSATGLYDYVTPLANTVTTLSFGDHHDFTEKDFKQITELFDALPANTLVITTEKDKARLLHNSFVPETIQSALYSVGINMEFLNNTSAEFNQLILDHIN